MNKKDNRDSFIYKFSKHRLAVAALCILAVEVLAIIFVPVIMGLDPITSDVTAFGQPPMSGHILGTDDVGRDILARVLYGGRTSLIIGIGATAVSVLIGLPLGLVAGYYRGKVETLIMRCADIFLSFPSMVLNLVIVAVFGSSVPLLIFVIGALHWPAVAKLIYGNVLSVRSREFVEAERTIGSSDAKIIFKTVLPNSIAPLWVSLSFRISNAMLTESALSFLGAGVQPPQASWGNIMQAAMNLTVLRTRWWQWIPAGLMLMLTIVCLNFVGEGIRDALDPKMKRL